MPSTLGDNFTVIIEGGDGGHAAAVASGFADDAEAYAAAAEAARDLAQAVVASENIVGLAALGRKFTGAALIEGSGTISPSSYASVSFLSGTTYEFEAIGSSYGAQRSLNIFCNSGCLLNAVFDFGAGICTGAGATMVAMGGGFYYCKVSLAATADASGNVQFMTLGPVATQPYAADGVSGLLLPWVHGHVAGSTTNLLPSTEITAAGFTEESCTPTTVTVTKTPAGARIDTLEASLAGVTGVKLTEGSGSVYTSLYRAFTFAAEKTYDVYVVARAKERFRLNLFRDGTSPFDATTNLTTGVSSGTGAGAAVYLGGGEWRCKASVAVGVGAGGGANIQLRVFPASGGHPYTGDGASGLHVKEVEIYEDGVLWHKSTAATLNSSAWAKDGMTAPLDAALPFGKISTRLETLEAGASLIPHPLAGKNVTFVGTSLIAGGLLTAAFAGKTGATVQALGSSGGSYGLDARGSPHYGSGTVTALFSSINADADVIIFDMPVNDFAAADVPFGSVTDTTTATLCGAIANAFIWSETNRPNAAVCFVVSVAASPSITPSDYTHNHVNANGNTLEDCQALIRRMCQYYGRPYIDPNAFGIGFLDMETGEATSDGQHWDASGAAKAAKIYAKQTKDFCDAGWLLSA